MVLRRPRGPSGALWMGAALVLALGLSMSACAAANYTYVSNASTQTYFKVPSSWKLFTKQQLLVATNLDKSLEASKSFDLLMGFDADPSPRINHVLGIVTQYPALMAQVRELSAAAQDQASLMTLRNLWIPQLDQLIQNDSADVLSLKEVVLAGGFHGIRMVYNISLGGNLNVLAGNQVVRVNQTAYLDPAAKRAYLLVISCTADCYQHNQTAINQIADSFTIREH